MQGKRLWLADLRMSGQLEMDAARVLFLPRPCVYEPGLPLAHDEQYAEVWAGQVREGKAGGMVPLYFTGCYATFSDWPGCPALERDPEGEQAWAVRLAWLKDEQEGGPGHKINQHAEQNPPALLRSAAGGGRQHLLRYCVGPGRCTWEAL